MSKTFRRFVKILFLSNLVWLLWLVAHLLVAAFALPLWGIQPLPTLPEDALVTSGVVLLKGLSQAFSWLFLSALMLTFALNPEGSPPLASPARILSSVSLVSILGASFLAVVTLLIHPLVEDYLQTEAYKIHQTKVLENAFSELKNHENQIQDHQQRQRVTEEEATILQRLITLRPHQRFYSAQSPFDYDFEYQIVRSHLEMEKFFNLRLLPGADTPRPEDRASVTELLAKAQQILKAPLYSRDNFELNHLAYECFVQLTNAENQGLSISSSQLRQAENLIDLSWRGMRDQTLSADERLKASYFFRKGKSLGDYQFQNYIEAYYGFQELHKEDPRDKEVERYEALCLTKLQGKIHFARDLRLLFMLPGYDNISFRNPAPPFPPNENAIELVHIGKLLETPQGAFVKDFEVLRYSPSGQVLLHWVAPFGEWIGQNIVFNVWHKSQPSQLFPEVLTQTPGNRLFHSDQSLHPYPLGVSAADIVFLTQNSLPQSWKTVNLLTDEQGLALMGESPLPWQTEFLFRLLSPLAFLALCFLGFWAAWRFQAPHQGKMPWIWWVLLVILPFGTQGVVETSAWLAKLVTAKIISLTGLWEAGVLLASLSLVAIVGMTTISWWQLRPRSKKKISENVS